MRRATGYEPVFWRILSIAALLLFGGLKAHADIKQTYERSERKLQDHGHYVVHAPIERAERHPIVLFLHGAGERGDDLELATSVGYPNLLRNAMRYNAVLVAPQIPNSAWWSDPAHMQFAMATLESVIADYRGDRNRLYIVGVSMGGHGVIQLGARHDDVFAGMLVICPRLNRPNYLDPVNGIGGNPRKLAATLKHTPTWLFHGTQDKIVPVSNSRRMFEALQGLSAPTNYTEFAGFGHSIWDQVLTDTSVIQWLFEQNRSREPRGI